VLNGGGNPDRERLLGATMLGVATLLATLIVAARLIAGRGEPELAQVAAPTPPVLTPVAPTAAPATPPPPPTVPPTVPPVAPVVATAAVAAAATAAPSPAATPPAGEALAYAGKVVCIDPGHGGADMGNVRVRDGVIQLMEKDFTLAHSLELGRLLEEKGVKVVYTRTTDSEVNPENLDVNGDGIVAEPGGEARSDQLDDLQARVNICNAAGADVLISVHYNGAENEFLEGYEVWYNDEREFSDDNARLASLVHSELGASYAAAGYDAFDKGIGIEAHAVTGPARPGKLTPSAMPGVVAEGLFLSNDEDADFIQRPEAQDTIAGAYERAILAFLGEPSA